MPQLLKALDCIITFVQDHKTFILLIDGNVVIDAVISLHSHGRVAKGRST